MKENNEQTRILLYMHVHIIFFSYLYACLLSELCHLFIVSHNLG